MLAGWHCVPPCRSPTCCIVPSSPPLAFSLQHECCAVTPLFDAAIEWTECTLRRTAFSRGNYKRFGMFRLFIGSPSPPFTFITQSLSCNSWHAIAVLEAHWSQALKPRNRARLLILPSRWLPSIWTPLSAMHCFLPQHLAARLATCNLGEGGAWCQCWIIASSVLIAKRCWSINA